MPLWLTIRSRRVIQDDGRRMNEPEVFQKRGRIPEALEHYRKAVRLNPNAIDARESLASGLLNQGEMAEAEQHFELC